MEQSIVITKMGALVSCLCVQIGEDGLPDVCACGMVPGEGASLDYTGNCQQACGMAWVRLIDAQPSTGVGIPNETVNNCGSTLGWTIEVGIARCIDVLDEQGNPPSIEVNTESAVLQVADMMTMRKAIACCDDLGDFMLGGYVPFGPDGGVVGGVWTLTLSEV